jgi:hypothetical protein
MRFVRRLSITRNFPILTVLFGSFVVSLLRADDKLLFAPRPTKDPKASKQHCQGAGMFEMIVDKPSGKVKEVYIRSSTNNVLLDADVMNTFFQWRFKPNTVSSVTLAVAFTADKDDASYPTVRNSHALNRGIQYPFKEPISAGKLWQGFAEFYGTAGHR